MTVLFRIVMYVAKIESSCARRFQAIITLVVCSLASVRVLRNSNLAFVQQYCGKPSHDYSIRNIHWHSSVIDFI